MQKSTYYRLLPYSCATLVPAAPDCINPSDTKANSSAASHRVADFGLSRSLQMKVQAPLVRSAHPLHLEPLQVVLSCLCGEPPEPASYCVYYTVWWLRDITWWLQGVMSNSKGTILYRILLNTTKPRRTRRGIPTHRVQPST